MRKKVFVIFVILSFVVGMPAYAYIDPGTGSMLLSFVIGIISTLFFLANSLFIKFKNLFIKDRKKLKDLNKNNIPFVIYSEGKQYFNVFKNVIDEFEKRQIPLMFYTSSPDDPFFENSYKYVKGEYIGKNSKAYTKLAFLKADVCLMTTPQLDVYQLRRSKYCKYYCHIFHAVCSSMQYRLFSLDYYDAVLCDGEFQIPMIRELEKKRNLKPKELLVTGCTYIDLLQNKLENLDTIKNNKPIILLAPTWGESGLLTKFGSNLIDKLIDEDWDVVIRPHPQSLMVEKDIIDKLVEKYKDNSCVKWNYDVENLGILSQADVLISDYSGIMFDYAFLFNKPFIYCNKEMNREIYDFGDLDGELWRDKAIKEIGIELQIDNLDNVNNIIKSAMNNSNYQDAIEKAKDIAWQEKGKSAQNIVDFLVSKQEELSKC